MPRDFLLAVSVLLLGVLAFDLMGILVRFLGAEYPILQISALRNLFGILPALFLLARAGHFASLPGLLRRDLLAITFLRSASVLTAQMSYYTALINIEFATATALAFSGPIFITAMSIPLLGHKIGLWRWSAIILGFVGVMTIMKPFGDGFSVYMILPVIAAACYSLSSILVRKFPDEIPSAAIQLNQQVCTCVLAVIALFLFQEPVAIEAGKDMLLFVLMGILGGIGVMCLVITYRLADPGSVSPFEYFGIPISFCLGWLFFAEAPFEALFPGILFIVGAGLLIMMRERRVAKT